MREHRWGLVMLAIALAVLLVGVDQVMPIVGQRNADRVRWSGYPHTYTCNLDLPRQQHRVDPDTGVIHAPIPSSYRITHVGVSHPGGQRLEIGINFIRQVPPTPKTLISRATGKVADAPNSINYTVVEKAWTTNPPLWIHHKTAGTGTVTPQRLTILNLTSCSRSEPQAAQFYLTLWRVPRE